MKILGRLLYHLFALGFWTIVACAAVALFIIVAFILLLIFF